VWIDAFAEMTILYDRLELTEIDMTGNKKALQTGLIGPDKQGLINY